MTHVTFIKRRQRAASPSAAQTVAPRRSDAPRQTLHLRTGQPDLGDDLAAAG
jgi:hypothetical protein